MLTKIESLSEVDIAVAHWHVRAWGGAEYLVTKLAETLDVDRIHTLGQPSPKSTNPYGDISWMDVTDSLDYTPLRRLQQRAGRTFEYAQWEDVDWRTLGDPDIVVTSGATTRAIITPDDTLHVNYCHSPPRWFYDLYHDRKTALSGAVARPLVRYLRTRDSALDSRVDQYLVNSPLIGRRLWKYYKRASTVLYPPVDCDSYWDESDGGYYLYLGRLDEEKGVPAIVSAFDCTDNQLVMAGGRGDVDDDIWTQIQRAQNIDYRGFVDESDKRELLARCRALVFNGHNEDFGIVTVEALASGKAILTRDDGFPAQMARQAGVGHLHDGTPAGIENAVSQFERDGVNGNPASFAERFDTERFASGLEQTLWEEFNRRIVTEGTFNRERKVSDSLYED